MQSRLCTYVWRLYCDKFNISNMKSLNAEIKRLESLYSTAGDELAFNVYKDMLEDKSIVDLTHLEFDKNQAFAGSGGMFYKACETVNGVIYYYKLSEFDTVLGEYGYESICEIMANHVCQSLGISHLTYELIHANIKLGGNVYTVWLVRSRNYKKPVEKRLTLESKLIIEGVNTKDLEANFSYVTEQSYANSIYSMLLVDYIICNRDRHGANIEMLYRPESIRVAPIFDCGCSFTAPLQYRGLDEFNIMHNGPVNSFLVSQFYEDIAKAVAKVYAIKLPIELNVDFSDLAVCFKQSGFIITKLCEKMAKERYQHVKEIFDTRGR